MALGRKKVTLPDDPAEEPRVEDVPEDAPVEAVAEASTEDDAADETTLSALGEKEPPSEEPAAGDGLLDMFTTVGIHEEDRTMLLNLAGEVDMDDLISELNVVAAALGIVMSSRNAASTEDLAEAA
jgi:hypothetical protein